MPTWHNDATAHYRITRKETEPMNEDTLKATHSMQFMIGNLQDALKRANPVESIVILGLIESAAGLQVRIENFHNAIKETETNG